MLSKIHVYVYPIPCGNLDFNEESLQSQDKPRLSGVVNKTNRKNWLYLIALLSFGEGKTLYQGAEINKNTSTEQHKYLSEGEVGVVHEVKSVTNPGEGQ